MPCSSASGAALSTTSRTPHPAHPNKNDVIWNAGWRLSFPGNERLLPRDFAEMIGRHNIDRELLREILRGMLMDAGNTGRVRFDTFADLEPYCRRVASAVGLVSARIFGTHGSDADRYAEHLGIALQLTNILRDVAEDAAMDRIYLPMEDLDRFGVTEQDILNGNRTPK